MVVLFCFVFACYVAAMLLLLLMHRLLFFFFLKLRFYFFFFQVRGFDYIRVTDFNETKMKQEKQEKK